ncbi:MAG: hypothetical protein ACR2N9_04760 [Acidimicrobiia bacterium]
MTRTVVTVVSIAGWAIGLTLLYRLRETRFEPGAEGASQSSFWQRLLALVARGAGSFVGALVAGILVMGLGGRLMMRVLAATSSDDVQGFVTDMDATVGEVTVDGTIGFILFIGAGSGLIGWLLRLGFRRWMPQRSIVAGLLGAGIGAGLLARGSSLLDPDNHDFAILSPTLLAVVLIVGLIVTFAMLLAVLADVGAQRWPTPQRPLGVFWLVPLLPMALIPPIALGAGLAVAVRAWFGTIDRYAWSARADQIGRAITLTASAVGAIWTMAAAVEILAN